jgi:hypothetical protein
LRGFALACSLLFASLALVGAGLGKERQVALVLGIGAYQSARVLPNASGDADLAEQTFSGLGFEVISGRDLTKAQLLAILDQFRQAALEAEHTVIYFAGHGVQANGQNFLLPVNVDASSLEAVAQSAIPLSAFLAALPDSGQAHVVFIDACRDNPFDPGTRSLEKALQPVSRGLAPVHHTKPDLLAFFAAQPGKTAFDGSGANGPFAAALASVFVTGDAKIDLSHAMIDVTNRVRTETAGAQTPFIEGSLSRRITLGLDKAPDHVSAPAAPTRDTRQCRGPTSRYSARIAQPEDTYVDLVQGTQTLVLADHPAGDISVCPAGAGVLVTGRFQAELTCEQMRNAENEGIGYYFGVPGDEEAHLWFYLDPDDADATVEIGVYSEGLERYWFGTDWQICQP